MGVEDWTFLSFMGELKMRGKSTDLVQAAMYNRIPQTRWLKQWTFLSHSSRGYKFKVMASAESMSGESLLVVDRWLCSCVLTRQRTKMEQALGSFIRDINPALEGSPLMTYYLLKPSSPNITILGLEFQHNIYLCLYVCMYGWKRHI